MAGEDLEEQEMFFECPYCGESISVLVDPSAEGQEYIEDCEVCCRPIQISFEVGDGGKITDFVTERAQ